MTLLIDCGNTRCKVARLRPDGTLAPVVAITLVATDFLPQLQDLILCNVANESCYFASVAEQKINAAIESVITTAGFALNRVHTQTEALGVRVAYPMPRQLGVDRFLGLLAAHQARQAALVVSVGSALTIDFLQSDGQHRGGFISATEEIINAAMAEKFPDWRNLSGHANGFSNNTADALASGARYLVLGMIEKTWREVCLRQGDVEPQLLVTGGGVEALLPHLPDNAVYRPTLVLEGLALWARHLEKF